MVAPSDAGALPSPIRLRRRGVNLSGAEFGSAAQVPGVYGRDYSWPVTKTADFFLDRGFNIFRIPFRHERLQPVLRGPLVEVELARLDTLVEHITRRGGAVILSPHNSFRHGAGCSVMAVEVGPLCHVLTEVEVGDFWGRLGAHFKSNPLVQVGITNEPHDVPGGSAQVVLLDNAAVRELRRVGFTGTVIAPGEGWTNAINWESRYYGPPNAVAMLGVKDSIPDALSFEVHLYMSSNGSGDGDCVSSSVGVERLAIFARWLRANGRTGVIGEIGGFDTPVCKAAVANALAYAEKNYDVLISWLAWGAGDRWSTSAPLWIGPTPTMQARPMLAWYEAHLPCGGIPGFLPDAGGAR